MAGNAFTNPWDDARVKELIALFETGLSAGQIAKQMGFTSRNAVIGKLSRLRKSQLIGPSKNAPCRPSNGVSGAKTYRPPRPIAPPRPPRPYVKRDTPANYPKPSGEHAARLIDLKPDRCRWIESDFLNGDGAEQFMCGEPVKIEGKPYCGHHHALAYWSETPSETKRRKDSLTRAVIYYDKRR